MATLTDRDFRLYAEHAIALQFMYKPDPFAYARELLASKPQLWIYSQILDDVRNDGHRVTARVKDGVWHAIGGK